MPRAHLRLLARTLAFLCLFLGSATASAQLELPKKKPTSGESTGEPKPEADKPKEGADREPAKPRPGTNGIVPHLVCSVCGEHNYISNFNRPQDDGTYLAYCSFCARDQSHSRSQQAEKEERIDLPGKPKGGANAKPKQGSSNVGGLSSSRVRYGDHAAGFILRQVADSNDVSASIVEKAVESLLGLGEEGLVASRIVLHDDVPAVVVVAGRVLIRAGHDEDAERIVARLKTSMPGTSAVLLLDELIKRNPVSASPALLIGLLTHDNKPLRNAARNYLNGKVTAAELPLIKEALKSPRPDSRAYVLELLEGVDDPEVLDIMLEHLDDRSSKVADSVIEILSTFPEERVDLELLARGLSSKWILRENAYALLAIMEREDSTLRAILDDRHAELLLTGLNSSDLFVQGTCAGALAGIGYRSERPFQTSWLDRDVTGIMVSAISGRRFHSDFAAMQPRVLRRLRLVTGVDFGTDGPRWASWWVDNRSNFYANRAFLSTADGDESKMEVHFRGTGRAAAAFSLIGADANGVEAKKRAGMAEMLFLTHRECLDLLGLMEREGVLGPQRTPGLRGTRGFGQREIEVVLDGRGKVFVLGNGISEPWFEKLASAFQDLRERNRWQRFPNATRFATTRAFWEEESGWWIGEHDELERGQRLKDLIFNSIKHMPPSSRTMALEELANLYETPGLAHEGDFLYLMDLLRDEGFYADRAKRLVELALVAGSSDMVSSTSSGDVEQTRLKRELGSQLIDLLLARFSGAALPSMGRIARSVGDDYVRELASSERPILRAVAAAELSRNPSEEDIARLMDLLSDPEVVVEASAAAALGEAGVEAARTELLLRARLADPLVRAAALRAVGRLGGEYVLEALVLGVNDTNPEVKRGAAEGLVALGDAQSAPLLISLLRNEPDSEVFTTARDGLMALGEKAKADMLRVVASPTHPARRECALLLSAMGTPEVVPAMIQIIGADPKDTAMAFELAVLTCYDGRKADSPAARWNDWFQGVTHEDSFAWLLAAMERRGIPVSMTASFDGASGSREGALFLLEVLGGDEDFLVERARRELSRMFGSDLGAIPSSALDRSTWFQLLRETILRRFES